MNAFLADIETEWKTVTEYKTVKAEYWAPGKPRKEACPYGCKLEIYENTPTKWGRTEGHDAYRQTRICRKHGSAIIYVITGPTASASNWKP